MTISLTHTTVATGTNDSGKQVSKNAWNEAHTITMATGKVLGRDTAGDGAVEELATTGTGSVVRATSPTLVTPTLGAATATSINSTSIPSSKTLVVTTDIGVSVQAYDANTVKSNVATSFTAQQNFGAVTLTSTSNHIAWNVATAQVAKHTATENTTLDNPTNMVDGGEYKFRFTQHASSAKTLAFGANFIFAGDSTVNTALSSVTEYYFSSDGTYMRGVMTQWAS